MNFSNVLGAVVQAGLARATQGRLRNVLGAEDDRAGAGGGLGDALSGLLGGGESGGGLDALSGLLGGQGGGGLGSMLQGVLGQAGQAVGDGNKLAIGGLGALAGSLLGGSGSRVKGAVGGGVMAMLGAMAFQALKNANVAGMESRDDVPVGLREPENDEESAELEKGAELMLRAMISAAKADGEIDRQEVSRIIGKLEEAGLDDDVRTWVIQEMQRPLDTAPLVEAAQDNPQLAAQLYAASMLAIEVDTPAEKQYLEQLAAEMNLGADVTAQLERMVGLQA